MERWSWFLSESSLIIRIFMDLGEGLSSRESGEKPLTAKVAKNGRKDRKERRHKSQRKAREEPRGWQGFVSNGREGNLYPTAGHGRNADQSILL
jgi:hypothetical protein